MNFLDAINEGMNMENIDVERFVNDGIIVEKPEKTIPFSVIEDIKAEIAQVVEREKVEDAKWALGLRYSLKIIDKHINGKESE